DISSVTARTSHGAPPLTHGAIRLEPISERFVPNFQALAEDPGVLRYTRVPERRDARFVAGWLAGDVQGWDDGAAARFAVVEPDGGAFLGMCGLIRIDWEASEAEIGYVV